VCKIDADCLLAGKWTWSFEFEKRNDFRVAHNAPNKGTRVPKAPNASENDEDNDNNKDDNNDGDNDSTGVPRLPRTAAFPLGNRRIQPGRVAKDSPAIWILAVGKI